MNQLTSLGVDVRRLEGLQFFPLLRGAGAAVLYAWNVAAYAAWTYMAAQADGDFGSAPGAFVGDGAGD